MNPALAGVALAITIGAIVAVSTRDARAAVLGLAVTLVGAPILADPMADTAALAGRVVAAVLATYLLWIAVRDGEWGTGGSRLGWASDASVAAAAAIAGYGTHGLGAPALGPPLAQAAGFALAALAVAPLVTGRDVVRIGFGLLLLTHGALLVRVALGGTPSALEQLVTRRARRRAGRRRRGPGQRRSPRRRGWLRARAGGPARAPVPAAPTAGAERRAPGRAGPTRTLCPSTRRSPVSLIVFLVVTFGAAGSHSSGADGRASRPASASADWRSRSSRPSPSTRPRPSRSAARRSRRPSTSGSS